MKLKKYKYIDFIIGIPVILVGLLLVFYSAGSLWFASRDSSVTYEVFNCLTSLVGFAYYLYSYIITLKLRIKNKRKPKEILKIQIMNKLVYIVAGIWLISEIIKLFL